MICLKLLGCSEAPVCFPSSSLFSLKVCPALLQVNKIRPSYFLPNSHEDFAPTARNSSARARLRRSPACSVRSIRLRLRVAGSIDGSWSEDAVSRIGLLEPCRRVVCDLQFLHSGVLRSAKSLRSFADFPDYMGVMSYQGDKREGLQVCWFVTKKQDLFLRLGWLGSLMRLASASRN